MTKRGTYLKQSFTISKYFEFANSASSHAHLGFGLGGDGEEKWLGADVESDSGQRVIRSLVRSLLGGMDLIEVLTSRQTGFLPTHCNRGCTVAHAASSQESPICTSGHIWLTVPRLGGDDCDFNDLAS